MTSFTKIFARNGAGRIMTLSKRSLPSSLARATRRLCLRSRPRRSGRGHPVGLLTRCIRMRTSQRRTRRTRGVMLRRRRGIYCIVRSFMGFRALRRFEMSTGLGGMDLTLETSLPVAQRYVFTLGAACVMCWISWIPDARRVLQICYEWEDAAKMSHREAGGGYYAM